MNAKLTVLHPAIETSNEGATNRPARLATLQGKRLALLDNGKVNAGVLLNAIAARLHGLAEVRAWKKQHAGQTGEKVIPELLAWKPDFALTGLGD